MTNTEFAAMAMRLAQKSSSWAADSISPPNYRDKKMSQEAADRYLKDQREILDYIEKQTRSPKPNTRT